MTENIDNVIIALSIVNNKRGGYYDKLYTRGISWNNKKVSRKVWVNKNKVG